MMTIYMYPRSCFYIVLYCSVCTAYVNPPIAVRMNIERDIDSTRFTPYRTEVTFDSILGS